jgi:hypothetical protein
MQIVITRVFLRPTNDELFGITIQITLMEGRRVHGIEQLRQFRELDLDESGHGRGMTKLE